MDTMNSNLNNFTYNLFDIDGFKDYISFNEDPKSYMDCSIVTTDYISKINQKYKIINYDKKQLPHEKYEKEGLLRSVILNSRNKILSFSPPKSLTYHDFIQRYPLPNSSIIAQEFIDGTMVNLFWDNSIGINGFWQISTKKSVGAEVKFYQNPNVSINKTFNDMFFEACLRCNINLNLLDKSLCYSFVLQHPENRIVTPLNKISLYLIEVYKIFHDNDVCNVEVIPLERMKNKEYINVNNEKQVYVQGEEFNVGEILKYKLFENTDISYPKTYKFDSYNELIQKFSNANYSVKGVVIRNIDNNQRCKIRNKNYEHVKQLKGNQPKLEYLYLSLRKENRVNEYLYYYPEVKYDFSVFRNKLHHYTLQLFYAYGLSFIEHITSPPNLDIQYRIHVYHLHNLYLTELKPANKKITFNEVIKYVNNLHPAQQMYAVNYILRK